VPELVRAVLLLGRPSQFYPNILQDNRLTVLTDQAGQANGMMKVGK